MSQKQSKLPSLDEFQRVTAARLEQLTDHLDNTPSSGKLKDKVCIITGVASVKGIGRAAALRFAHEGAKHLYLLDYSPDNLPDLKSTIENKYHPVKVTIIHADAADEAAISGVCKQALEEEGRLDVFFANAGWASQSALQDITVDEFMKSMRINSLSCFLALKYASKAMLTTNPSRGKEYTGGSIIMTASVAGLRSGAGPIDYSASKAAVNSMAKTAAYQLSKTNIRVNSLCPGLIETGMTEMTFNHAKMRGTLGKVGQLNPLGRYGLADEIATVAAFLASDDSSYINGQNIAVDGGLSASHPVVPGKLA